MTYGPANYGLQLAAWFDQERAVAYGAIRSANKLAVRYCDYLVGNFEFVEVYARRSSTEAWRRMPRRESLGDGYLSASPRRQNTRWLSPGRIMPPGPYGAIARYVNASQVRHTLEVDFRSFVFPADWTGDVESKIVQHMLNDVVNEESRGSRQLESTSFSIRLPLIADRSR